MSDAEIKTLTHDVQRLELRPGDVIVVRFMHALSNDTRAHLRHMLSGIWPEHKAVILESGAQIQVIRMVAEGVDAGT